MNYSNITLLTDFYQLTMLQGYFLENMTAKVVVFDLFYRNNPSENGFAIAAGLEQVVHYIENIEFREEDIEFLRAQGCFVEPFLDYLRNFKFTGDIYAVPEGTVVFPHEPLVRVKAKIMEAQFIETALLTIVNHQSLIATKAARVVYSANGDTVFEFGLRRAQGADAGIYGARAAIIGGCHATSNVLCGKMFDVPIKGTHAHSWIMSFNTELEAFRAYAKIYPQSLTLLVDTYDTIKSGVPNAITVFSEMVANGVKLTNYGIRLDSGDFAYLSKKAREMLDDAGFCGATITASSDLDEFIIRDLKIQGAKITVWGVGTSLITSKDCPAFGGVYKLSAETSEQGELIPKIKLSENPEKVTNPGEKKVIRIVDKKSGKIKADLIALIDETIDESVDLTLFDAVATWKKMTLCAGTFTTYELLVPIFVDGKCVYDCPTVLEAQQYCNQQKQTLWGEHKRLVNPHLLPVDLSLKLWNLKQNMIAEIRNN